MHNTYRSGFRANHMALLFLIMAAFSALSSCITQRFIPSSPEHPVFRSDEYIICKLTGNETPESLAERFLNNPEKSWIIEDANEEASFTKGEVIVIPLKQENKGGVTADGYQTVPVIGYNHFSEKCEKSPCIPALVFDQQMKYLKDNGYRVISMNEFLDFLYYRSAIPKRSVVITIDGGHSSAYNIAYPILQKYGLSATFFIYPDSIGINEMSLTWDHLKKLKAEGFEVGSFAFTSRDIEVKKEQEDEQAYWSRIKKELLLAKQIIDKELSQDTPYLAFPSAEYNQELLNICDQAGYKMAFTMQPGSNPFFSDPLSLKRNIIIKEDMETFIGQLKTYHESQGSQ